VTYKRSIEHDVNMDYTEYHNQWCRSVVKYGARVSQVKPSNCFRRLEKLIFTFPFWRKSFIPDDVKLAELSNNSFKGKNAIFLGDSKHTLTPPTYFQEEVKTSNPGIYRPRVKMWAVHTLLTASIVFLSMTNIPSMLTPIGSPFRRFRNTFICRFHNTLHAKFTHH